MNCLLSMQILTRQQQLREQYRGFLYGFDQKRIVTLAELLEMPDNARERLNAEWLVPDIIRERCEAVGACLSGLTGEYVRGFENMRLVFFHSTTADEDQREFDVKCGTESVRGAFFKDNFGHLPPQALYLHMYTNFIWHLRRWGKTKSLAPLLQFSAPGIGYKKVQYWKPGVIGYRIPDYAEVLGVARETATEYFCRIILHDVGHGVVPDVHPDHECYHNVAMITAAKAKPYVGSNAWERLVHEECTNPVFFLHAPNRLACVQADTPVKQAVVRTYRQWYASKKRMERLELRWGVTPELSVEEAEEKVKEKISELLSTGFACYRHGF